MMKKGFLDSVDTDSDKTNEYDVEDFSIAFIEKMTEFLQGQNMLNHLDISGLQLMQVAKSQYKPWEQQHAKGDIQGSDNWFKVMDFFQAIHNAYFLLSVHLSDNEILSQREEALYNQNKTPD